MAEREFDYNDFCHAHDDLPMIQQLIILTRSFFLPSRTDLCPAPNFSLQLKVSCNMVWKLCIAWLAILVVFIIICNIEGYGYILMCYKYFMVSISWWFFVNKVIILYCRWQNIYKSLYNLSVIEDRIWFYYKSWITLRLAVIHLITPTIQYNLCSYYCIHYVTTEYSPI